MHSDDDEEDTGLPWEAIIAIAFELGLIFVFFIGLYNSFMWCLDHALHFFS